MIPRSFALLLAFPAIALALPAAAGEAPSLRAIMPAGGAAASIADTAVSGFLLTSPQGVKVFVDVAVMPEELLPELENPRNIFLVTHPHPDHLDRRALDAFKGKKLVGGQPVKRKGSSIGTVSSGDVKVEGIASSHMDDELDGTTDGIMVIDVAGVRVVHLGDCGQTRITRGQMKIIGRLDVMIHALEDPLGSDSDVVNRKAYKVLAQVAPKIVIPTHILSPEAFKLLDAAYPAEIASREEIVLSPALLAGPRRAVIMGVNRERAAKAGVRKSDEL